MSAWHYRVIPAEIRAAIDAEARRLLETPPMFMKLVHKGPGMIREADPEWKDCGESWAAEQRRQRSSRWFHWVTP